MVTKEHRFSGRTSLRYVYSKGKTVRGALFAIKYIENGRRDSYRAAVVVSKKVSKTAVARNRARRRVYEIIRRNEADIARPFDVVVTIFNDGVADMPADRLESVLVKQLKEAGILGRRLTKTPPPK